MFLEILIAIMVGCLVGIFTGLFPGIHINLVSVTVLSISAFLFEIADPISVAVFIVAMSITHTFLDSIPSIFLGAPEADTALSVLPGHRLLLKGHGFEAVMLTLIGSLFSLVIAILVSPLIKISIEFAYPILKSYIAYLLILISLFLIFREKIKSWSLIIFLLSGILGILVLNLPTLSQPLLPLFSGLFGISILLMSINNKTKIPKQKLDPPNIPKKEVSKAISGSLIAGSVFSFLPGLGPAQAAIMASQLMKNLSEKGFLILVGGLNTINMVVSFLALYVIDKARNGSVVVISKIVESITLEYLILFFSASLIAAGIATFLTIYISKIFSKLITRISYKKLVISIISIITLVVILISGLLGFLVLVVSTALGLLPSLKGIGKNHLMGSLIIPVIFFLI